MIEEAYTKNTREASHSFFQLIRNLKAIWFCWYHWVAKSGRKFQPHPGSIHAKLVAPCHSFLWMVAYPTQQEILQPNGGEIINGCQATRVVGDYWKFKIWSLDWDEQCDQQMVYSAFATLYLCGFAWNYTATGNKIASWDTSRLSDFPANGFTTFQIQTERR